MTSLKLSPGVTILREHEVRALYQQIQHVGHPIFVLETKRPADREAFFTAVRNALPLDPPLASSRSWDALSDSLWEGLETLDASRVVILWPDAYRMKARAPSDYEIAVSVLDQVANSLQVDARTAGHSIEVCVYLASAEDQT